MGFISHSSIRAGGQGRPETGVLGGVMAIVMPVAATVQLIKFDCFREISSNFTTEPKDAGC